MDNPLFIVYGKALDTAPDIANFKFGIYRFSKPMCYMCSKDGTGRTITHMEDIERMSRCWKLSNMPEHNNLIYGVEYDCGSYRSLDDIVNAKLRVAFPMTILDIKIRGVFTLEEVQLAAQRLTVNLQVDETLSSRSRQYYPDNFRKFWHAVAYGKFPTN